MPRHHESDFGRATDEQLTGAAEALQKVIRLLNVLDGPPYNLVLHTAPLHESVSETFHWHWEIHPRLRDIAGLELGTGLPVNPISPEGAVDELLATIREASGEFAPHDDPSTGRAVERPVALVGGHEEHQHDERQDDGDDRLKLVVLVTDGFIGNEADVLRAIAENLDDIGLDIAPSDRISDLTIAQKQMVEIVKAMSCNARILIMDEPTRGIDVVAP